ncbi:hypothetical protein ACH46_00035 [Gordonia phthalatica]|uniref:DUF3566 domain-containing protein n=1 Tax=Gordonia phthalatica TaxID=1136941 RepID=A0A0N9NCM0_9ACTN|nr:hypothetical protein ACH46_00035 [Gordonia phthalatica]
MTPPWKRGEQSAATGLTAGEMAKAAGVAGDDHAGGPPPRGVVSGSASRPESKPASGQVGPSGSTPPTPAPSSAPSTPAPGPQASSPHQSGAQPSGAQPSGPKSGPIPAQTPPKPTQPAPAAKPAPQPVKASGVPQVTPTAAAPAKPIPAPAPAKTFVESETRNIPRERLVGKDELPDLDSIHHTEQAKEQALARAASKTIPARASSSAPLRAAVQIRRVDPWSIFKVAGVLCIAGFFIWMIAVAILYGVLGGMGIWDQINSSFGTIVNGDGSTSGQDLISGGQVFMFSALFGIASAVLITALATISAYIYNVCADFVGGVEVTLADLD